MSNASNVNTGDQTVEKFCLTWEALRDGYRDNDDGIRNKLKGDPYLGQYLKRIQAKLPYLLVFHSGLKVSQRVVQLRKYLSPSNRSHFFNANTFRLIHFLKNTVPYLDYNFLDPNDQKGGNVLAIQFLLLLEMDRRKFNQEIEYKLNDKIRSTDAQSKYDEFLRVLKL